MSYGKVPGIPRGRLRSHADAEPIPERVYEVLQGFDSRIEGLEESAHDGKRADAEILAKLTRIEATDRHATTKLIAGLATTAILTIGGILGGQQLTKPAPTVEHVPVRSALDVKLDVCRPMTPGTSREECFARVTSETDH